MTDKDEKLTLKDMCALFDVTPRTLRYYEYIELLSPEKRGRTRFYGPKEKARMTLILRGRKVGFSLEQVRQWLELYEKDPSQKAQMETLVSFAKEQRKELLEKRQEVDEALEELENYKNLRKNILKMTQRNVGFF